MIVVADTSPLNYLIQIDCDGVLPALYQTVLVPLGVVEELKSPKAPAAVSAWTNNIPVWIEVHQPAASLDTELSFLDRGEREAIQLAEEHEPGVVSTRLAHWAYCLRPNSVVDSKTRPIPVPFAAANYRLTGDCGGRWKQNIYMTAPVGVKRTTLRQSSVSVRRIHGECSWSTSSAILDTTTDTHR
jgi:hypothetical protein